MKVSASHWSTRKEVFSSQDKCNIFYRSGRYFLVLVSVSGTMINDRYIARYSKAAKPSTMPSWGKIRMPPTIVQSVSERRYALQTVKQRLHQASFREAVISAYNGRCALSGFPEQRLLDAAHIISDKDERLGQPVVPNGLPLSKIHHAAFDAHLIGIDPDYRLHVSERLLDLHDGPMLEALKQLDGGMLHLPNREKDYPDRDRLSLRYEQFKVAA